MFCVHSITGWIPTAWVMPGYRSISSSLTNPFVKRFIETEMSSSVFSINFPRFFGANIPWRKLSSAFLQTADLFSSLHCQEIPYAQLLHIRQFFLRSWQNLLLQFLTHPLLQNSRDGCFTIFITFWHHTAFLGSSIISQPALLRS